MNLNYLMLHDCNFRTMRIPRIFFSITLICAISSCGSTITYSGGVFIPTSGSATTTKPQPPSITTFTSKERLKEIGAAQHEEILKTQPLYKDESLQEYVRHVGSRVAKSSEQPDFDYQFFILDSPIVNAMAAPGGYIYINRGLLMFLTSEAQLAAVLGHEIGHITGRHFARQGNRDALGRGVATVAGFATGIATGSNFVGSQFAQLGSLWAQTASAGFGRNLELEADGSAAEYLIKSGYDPQAMFEFLTITKDYKDWRRRSGAESTSYHGTLATHPRTDRRLQELIAEAGKFNKDGNQIDNENFRKNLDGLPIFGGSNASNRTIDERNRYYQDLLAYTLVFPDDWQIDATITTVTASGPGVGSLRVEAQLLREYIEPRLFIRDKLKINNLQETETLSQYRLEGHTGVAKNLESGRTERIAVIYLGSRAFIFRGDIIGSSQKEATDDKLLSSIRSFREIEDNERTDEVSSELGSKIRYYQASEFFDFSLVPRQANLDPAQQNILQEALDNDMGFTDSYTGLLRLINGYYPSGSPNEGDWIKLLEFNIPSETPFNL